MTTIFDHIINTILNVDLRRNPAPDGSYHADCPLCGKQHKPGQTHFVIMPNKSGTGHNYRCYVCGEGGSLSQLAEKLGIATYEPRKETIYPYYDEEGTLLYEAVRYEPGKGGKSKGFYQRLPDGTKRLGNVRRVLYDLPEILAHPDETIYIVEGEKDVERLRSLGLLATSNVGGAGKWREEFSQQIPQKHIIIIPDNDDPGEKHANDIAQSLLHTGKTARILRLNLPPKGDVSDWLNNGGSIDKLRELADAAVAVAVEPTQPTQPTQPDETSRRTESPTLEVDNQRYGLPPGYDFDNGILYHLGKLLYMGKIYVPETGINMHSGEQTALIKWQGGGTAGDVVALHSDIASQGGITKILGGAGAAVHAYNAKLMSRFLVEFIQVNRQTIPHVKHSEYYGNIEDGMILPAGNIITTTRYIGTPIQVGKDRSIYADTLRAIQEWAPPVLWAVLAFGLASPFYGRLKVDRNPILHLGGASGAGKTTIAHFATGAYGDPRVTPLQTQCGSGTTTPKGMSTALLQANGLPVFFDDIHKMLERKKQDTEGIMYDFANGQNRTWGTVGNRATGGGQELHGTLITGGETSLSFLNAGSNNRVFSFECSMPDQYPLGCQARSSLGMQRARQLQAAWGAGAGTLGYALAQTALRDWQLFKTDIRAFELDSHLEPLQAWRRLLAVAAATLQAVSILADLELDIDRLMRIWSDTLQDNNHTHDPAEEAFERVKVLFIQGQQHFDATTGWHRIEYDRKLIAVRRENQTFWRCMHTSTDFTTVVGVNAVEMFGSTWLKHGWLLPHKNGKIIASSWVGSGSPKCILVNNFLHDEDGNEQ